MNVFFSTNIHDNQAFLAKEETHHLTNVMRKSIGDIVHVTDGIGNLYVGKVMRVDKKHVVITNLRLKEKQNQSNRIIIAISPPKSISRFEWFLEKATEIGVSIIMPIICSRSIRKVVNIQRSKKILISAMKQSKNLFLPELTEMNTYQRAIISSSPVQNKYIAYCNSHTENLANVNHVHQSSIVFIGPEGGFTENEISVAMQNNFKAVSLGNNILRTETAGVVATHIISLQHYLS